MKQYLFVIAMRNAMCTEVVKIAESMSGINPIKINANKNGEFKLSNDNIRRIRQEFDIKRKYKEDDPILIFVSFPNEDLVKSHPDFPEDVKYQFFEPAHYLMKPEELPLSRVMQLFSVNTANDLRKGLILNVDYGHRPYSCWGMQKMTEYGFSKTDINSIRHADRAVMLKAKVEEEINAKKAVDEAEQIENLLIVRNLAHDKYKIVTDLCHWKQAPGRQNILIFSETGRGVYVGFRDIAQALTKEIECNYEYGDYHCEFPIGNNEAKILAAVKRLSKKKMKEDQIIYCVCSEKQ